MISKLQTIIDEKIPPAANMGFKVDDFDGERLLMSAPLDANLNHHGTAFGGSQYSLAAVCGWAFVLLKLSEVGLKATIVVKNANAEYIAPVQSTLRMSCTADSESVETFIQKFSDTGRARLIVTGIIPAADSSPAARFCCTYTAFSQITDNS